jgi:LysR family transcriptional regulator, glycine cleavage system transcriptional activator
VCRHLSFTKAAEDLGMTQAAVSYQIKLLEGRLGTALFLRLPRGVMLTEAGEKLSAEIIRAFAGMREAFHEASKEYEGTLKISVVPTFAAHWLAQNLEPFQAANPELILEVESSHRLVDLEAGEFDVAIRSGISIPDSLCSYLLARADFTPMLSPQLAGADCIRTPSDLLNLPMIAADDPWFSLWFERAGVEGYSGRARRASPFTSQGLQAAAAMAGRGVAMLSPVLYEADVAAGRLAQPFDLLASDGRGYYVVHRRERRIPRKVRLFCDWIVHATETMREVPAR